MQTILDLFNEFFTKSIDVRFLDDNEFKDYTTIKEWFEQAFKRLESIDNSNSSEAMKCVLDIENNYKFYAHNKQDIDYQCNTIKQALLKAQEPKHYLKWEDLEFKKKQQVMDVLLNGKPYILYFYKLATQTEVNMFAIDMHIVTLNSYYPEDVQFFNDLHLEVVK